MAGKIPREFIDDLLARTDIVEIVDNRVRLKKAGKNYSACCPFHDEKTPSFTVSQDKQFYHCFGCGEHGNAISFLMEYDRLDFVEAIEELARIHGLDVPREQGSSRVVSDHTKQQNESDFQLMEKVTRFFQHQFKHHSQGNKAVEYLKQRGLSGEIVKQWEIGYAPPDWDAVLSTFGNDNSVRKQLIDLKLVNQNDNGKQYDFFRDRIMFPIRDKRGRVCGFGGRLMDGNGPKYLNSPETRIFHKGYELFGYFQTRQQRNLQRIMVVEGYMDVVALSQFGIPYATAALGTATTQDHMTMLMRGTQEIVCCYDGDRAGRDAAWRAVENALPVLKDGIQLKFLFLPDGEDPDTMVRQIGKEAFEQLVADAAPLSHFFFDTLLKQHSVGTPEGKIALKSAAQPLIDQVIGEQQKSMLSEELSKHVGEYDRFKLDRDIRSANAGGRTAPPSQRNNNINKTRLSPISVMIRLLLEHPSLATQCEETVQPDFLEGSGIAGLQVLQDVFTFCIANSQANTAQVLENFRDYPYSSNLGRLLIQEHFIDEADAPRVFRDCFARLLDLHFDSRIDQLLSKSRIQSLTSDEKQELTLLMKERQGR
ncbi:DNA primase [Alteromonas gilva]|uniref:DNA primase n=1 Tax=Alteromonas gilva TaxID=2987522 RepID=A0ABT5L0L3_9ALTE|nr:DNA primase [Alteromonas gilva]MDC8829974.1 DNA primase [Alteromonas gilva]